MREEHQNQGDAERSSEAELTRRRLLRMAAYVAPVVLTFGMPRSGGANAVQSPCCTRPPSHSCRWSFW